MFQSLFLDVAASVIYTMVILSTHHTHMYKKRKRFNILYLHPQEKILVGIGNYQVRLIIRCIICQTLIKFSQVAHDHGMPKSWNRIVATKFFDNFVQNVKNFPVLQWVETIEIFVHPNPLSFFSPMFTK